MQKWASSRVWVTVSYLALESAVKGSNDYDLAEVGHQLAEGNDIYKLRHWVSIGTRRGREGKHTNWPSSMPMQSKSAASFFTSLRRVQDTAASICLLSSKRKA
jgi:hypothetical protein